MLTSLAPLARPRFARPRIDFGREMRLRHIEVAARMLACPEIPVREIAQRHGITRRTAYRWRDLALTYDDPEAEGLRRMRREAQG